ncbi:MAG TPA: class I SAM-dependent methyltransferase [Humisphaera sp.]
MKSTVEEIRARFDADVERFSNLETGQSATVDAPLVLDLIAEAAAGVTPGAKAVLDVGCGAGNYTLKLLGRLPGLDCTLLDLSRPMLDRAAQRVSAAGAGRVTTVQSDVRGLSLPDGSVDVILAAAVLHHLRAYAEWDAVFAAFHRWLRPGGSVWVSDLVSHDDPVVQAMMWRRYGEYLSALKGGGEPGDRYRRQVFDYIEKEDSPRSLEFQLDVVRRSGFGRTTVLHKNGCFAAYGAVRG